MLGDCMENRKDTIRILSLTTLLVLFSFAYVFASDSDDEYLKIGLKYGSNSVSSCTITSNTGFVLGTVVGDAFQEGMPLPGYQSITATYENGYIVIRDASGTTLSTDLGTTGCIMPTDYRSGGILYYNGTPYRGGIMLLSSNNGTMKVINFISMEYYLYGVLNSEMGYTAPIEALKAQAVAARSFAIMNLDKHAADGFDLCCSTHCQVYKGYSDEHERTNKAIDETAGKLLYSDGNVVTGYYYKNSGGYTQDSKDVWSFSQSYLKAVKDEYSPSYPWTATLTFDAIESKLESAGYGDSVVQSVAITEHNTNGSVAELTIKRKNDSICLSKEKIRTVLGSTTIKSTRFSLADQSTAQEDGWMISNGTTAKTISDSVYVINGSGIISEIVDSNIYSYNGTTSVILGQSLGGKTVITGGTVYFSGYGYGHGVGMPQDSAMAMAEKGFTYDQILQYFYTNIVVQ